MVPQPLESYQGDEPFIFVSYSHADTDVVHSELAWLHANGYRVWYDEGIPLTEEWKKVIVERIDKCALFMAFVSASSMGSEEVVDEITRAFNSGKRFLAIHLEETALPPALETRMGRKQFLKKFELAHEQYRRKLSRDLPGELKGDPAAEGTIGDGTAALKSNLPRLLPSFVGRREQLKALQQALKSQRLTTLVGPPGCGKTRLALEAALRNQIAYSGGAWIVDLAQAEDEGSVERAVGSALSLTLEPQQNVVAAVAKCLSRRHSLLILDNCDRVTKSAGDFAKALLNQAPKLTVLATSRRPLSLRDEIVYSVPPLGAPQATVSNVDELLRSESGQLLCRRAEAKVPGFKVTDASAEAIARLCIALEGIPLAIELAVPRLSTLSPEKLLQMLNARLDFLRSEDTDSDPHQLSLRATVQWSFELLAEPEQALLCKLSALTAGWTLELAEIACRASGLPPEKTVDYLQSLLRASLISRDPDSERYQMLVTIRQYCQELLIDDDRDRLFEALTPWAIDFARHTKPDLLGDQSARVRRVVHAEYENIRACLDWLREHDRTHFLDLVVELDRFWFRSGMLAEGCRWLELASETATEDKCKAGVVKRSLGTFYWQGGDLETADTMLLASIEVLRDCGDKTLLSGALTNYGSLKQERGEPEKALPYLQEALECARGNNALSGLILQNMGNLERDRGNLNEAMGYLDRALPLAESSGDKFTAAVLLSNMGDINRRLGRLELARKNLLRSVELAKELENAHLLGGHIINLAQLLFDAGQGELAATLVLSARAVLKHSQSVLSEGNAAELRSLEEALRATIVELGGHLEFAQLERKMVSEIADFAISKAEGLLPDNSS